MYTKFFGLKKRPFVLSPDPAFLFRSRGHDLALTHLEYGLIHNVGFIALTGEVGAGKTTLLKYLFEKISSSIDTALILNTHLEPLALLETLVKEFEIQVESNHKSDLVDALFQHFLKAYSDGGRCVVVVDEAQNLPLDSFEELRMLSNLEAGSEFLVQIVLVGQPQLKVRLMDPALAQLTQRISVHYHLSPLSQDEVGNYIEHRLLVSGYDRPEPIFTQDAVCCVASFSQGIPRVISSICDAAMTYAFADDVPSISEGIIERVILDNELLFLSSKQDDGDAESIAALSDRLSVVPTADESQVAGLYGELRSLEARIKVLESAEQDKAIMVLRELLTEEKERSRQSAHKAVLLEMRCKNLASMVEVLRKGQKAAIEKSQEPRKGWRLFRGGKK